MKIYFLFSIRILWGSLIVGLPISLLATSPEWWAQFMAIRNYEPADEAAINRGQAKHLFDRAYEYIDDTVYEIGGVGDDLIAYRDSDAFNDATRDYEAMTIGEMKIMARPIYDFLNSEKVGFDTSEMHPSDGYYPWSDDDSFDNSPLLGGQLKYVFKFDLTDWEAPEDSIEKKYYFPEEWMQIIIDADPNDEIETFDDVLRSDDFDDDGLSNEYEYDYHTNPTNPDSDGDGFSDFEELNNGDGFNDPSITPETIKIIVRYMGSVVGFPGDLLESSPILEFVRNNDEVMKFRTVTVIAESGSFALTNAPEAELLQSIEFTTDQYGDIGLNKETKLYFKLGDNMGDETKIRFQMENQSLTLIAKVELPGNIPVEAPTNVRSEIQPDGSVLVGWHDNSNHETGYIIERQALDGHWYKVGRVDANVTTFLYTEDQEE